MKRFQFSISGLLALMVIVGLVLSLRGGLTSHSSPYTIWTASFLFSYWKSSRSGWRQVGRTTMTALVVWGVLVLCAYALFLGRRGAPSPGELALHGFIVVLAAALAALTIACLVEGGRTFVRRLRRTSWSHNVMSVIALLVLVPLAWAAWTTVRPRYWEPTLATSADQAPQESLPYLHGGVPQPHLEYVYVVASADGRFLAAILNGQQKMVVIDSASGEDVARLNTAKGEWFGDVTFHPDSKALAALLYSRTAVPRLVQWDAPNWSQREPVPLDDWLDRSKRDDRIWLSLDRRLLIVYSGALHQGTENVEIFTADLLEDPLRVREFASARIDAKNLPRQRGVSTVFNPGGWLLSANGRWIATSGLWTHAAPDYLFCRQARTTRLGGRAIGFVSDSEYLAVYERSVGFYWKREQPVVFAPPFWGYLRLAERSRVSIYDCRNRELIAHSRWFADLFRPCMTPDRSQLLVEMRDRVLIFDVAGIDSK